jgi:2-iminoacetate synthase ThiH
MVTFSSTRRSTKKVEEMIELGGSGVLMQGGLHPDLPLDYYTGLLRELKSRYGIHLHCFSPTEIYGLSKVTGLGYGEVLKELKDAGLDSLLVVAGRYWLMRSAASVELNAMDSSGLMSWKSRTALGFPPLRR